MCLQPLFTVFLYSTYPPALMVEMMSRGVSSVGHVVCLAAVKQPPAEMGQTPRGLKIFPDFKEAPLTFFCWLCQQKRCWDPGFEAQIWVGFL